MSAFRSFLLVALLFVALPASANTTERGAPTFPNQPALIPDSRAGREFAAWLAAFNGHDLRHYSEYLQERSPELAKYAKSDYDFSLLVGRFTPVQIDSGDDLHLSGLLSEPYADVLTRFTIRLDSKPPHHILALDLGAADRPASMPLPELDDEELVAALDDRLNVQAADGRFSGVVLVANGDRILFHRAYGASDATGTIANTTETRFNIASMGKMFTAVAVMQLVDMGKLDLHAALSEVIPGYPGPETARKVTVHQLLTHTGGMGDIFVPEIERQWEQIHSHADYIARLKDRVPEFEPGTRWSYSNYGYVLLGRAIEIASGMSYEDYVRDNILARSGMLNSGKRPLTTDPSPSAIGFTRSADDGAWHAKSTDFPDVPSAAGGQMSTAMDLYRFARALEEETLLDRANVEKMTRGKVDAPFGRYGYGFKEQFRRGVRYIGHGGGAPGSNGELDVYPESGHIVIVLTNQDPPYGNRIAEFIGNRLKFSSRVLQESASLQ